MTIFLQLTNFLSSVQFISDGGSGEGEGGMDRVQADWTMKVPALIHLEIQHMDRDTTTTEDKLEDKEKFL